MTTQKKHPSGKNVAHDSRIPTVAASAFFRNSVADVPSPGTHSFAVLAVCAMAFKPCK